MNKVRPMVAFWRTERIKYGLIIQKYLPVNGPTTDPQRPIGLNSLHIRENMDRLKKLSKKFLNGELHHTIFQREVADLFKSERFFKDELREFAQAILTQAILKGRMGP